MEGESQPSWLLIAIASLSVVLGVIALIIAFDAKSASDDAADQASVNQVSAKLSRLIDRLGIAEQSLSGKEKAQQQKDDKTARQARSAERSLSSRLATLEKQTRTLTANQQKTGSLSKRVGSLENEVGALDQRVATLNQRVTKLSRRVDSSGGGQAAP